MSSMHLRDTRRRSSAVSLKARAFLRFQIFQAMAVVTVASSKLRHFVIHKSLRLAGPLMSKSGKKNLQTSLALGHISRRWSTSSLCEQERQAAVLQSWCRKRRSLVGRRFFQASQQKTLHLRGAALLQNFSAASSILRCLKELV